MKTYVCSGYDARTVLQHIDGELEAGLAPTLAIVFCAVSHDFSALGQQLGERGLAVVGATTAGEIADAEVLEDACVVMLLEIDHNAFAVEFQARGDDDTMEALAQRLGRAATARFSHPILLAFASGIGTDGEAVVRGVRAGAGRDLPLFGGLAADDLKMENTYVFASDGASEEGLIGLILDGDRFEVEGIATSGWQSVGVDKVVTRSEANVVYAIDGEPALDVYRKYFDLDDQVGRQQSIAMALGVQFPLSVQRENGTSVLRAPLLSDPESQALIFAGGVPEGARVKFCIPPSLDIVDQVVEEAATVQRCVPEADALILISCKARHAALGPLVEDEIGGLHSLWNAPMLGYFSYGEIGGREPHLCDFHNETCTLVTLRAIRD